MISTLSESSHMIPHVESASYGKRHLATLLDMGSCSSTSNTRGNSVFSFLLLESITMNMTSFESITQTTFTKLITTIEVQPTIRLYH